MPALLEAHPRATNAQGWDIPPDSRFLVASLPRNDKHVKLGEMDIFVSSAVTLRKSRLRNRRIAVIDFRPSRDFDVESPIVECSQS